MAVKSRKKRWILGLFTLLVLGMFIFGAYLLEINIPDNLSVVMGEKQTGILKYPLNQLVEEEAVVVSGSGKSNIPRENLKLQQDSYTIECKLFGIIPVKSVQVDVVDRQKVVPGGFPVGIYIHTKGILVVGTGAVSGMDGVEYEPAASIVQSGDYILGVNGNSISSKEDLISQINMSKGENVTLQVERKGAVTELSVLPVMTGVDEYKAGIWVRDDTQGIGTMTYMDEQNHFGALGHGISDVDTGTLLALEGGKIYQTEILSVVKGEKGIPGELAGIIRYNDNEILGEISANTEAGIFGTVNDTCKAVVNQEPVEVALKQEVETGPAVILCSVNGVRKEYDIEIQKVLLNSKDTNKSMVIKVIDEELLSITGGIVQGMSGSPILQQGKLVGAVTHVFIQDATSGFGIFAENMTFVDSCR